VATSPYHPTAPPRDWRPFALVNAHHLADDMMQDLPRVLASYPNLAAGSVLDDWNFTVRQVGTF
jgi:hypothetical protein